ncbi:MAG: DNA mismatch repair endonuclease MutL [Alphaproteobacteria bacterium]
MTIRRLPETLVNRIAAGEVVERPASAVKELVENALDAGARHITIRLRDGGRSHISVADDGAGMTADELVLAIERHATSKLPDDDLLRIHTLGFRGEALPSIGAVSRLTITSRPCGSDEAWRLAVDGGVVRPPTPAAHPPGTTVEVDDLFFATPARLKFLKSARAEQMSVMDTVRRLAMAFPRVTFHLEADGGRRLSLEATDDLASAADDGAGHGYGRAMVERLAAILGVEFTDNALAIDALRDGHRLQGHISLPTYNRASPQHQYLFVNGRPVRDRMLNGALRGAYQDVLARDRHPVVALFLDVPETELDVNVHPMKSEVRFRDAALVRGLLVGGLRHALADAGFRVSGSVAGQVLAAFRPGGGGAGRGFASGAPAYGSLREEAAVFQAPLPGESSGRDQAAALFNPPPAARTLGDDARAAADSVAAADFPLGVARGQLHETYIVAQTDDGLVLVDQHAAHERLVYERIKAALATQGVARQGLLIPEVIEMADDAAQRVLVRQEELAELGLVVEPFGDGAVVVREVPALLGVTDTVGLVRDLADELMSFDEALSLRDRLELVSATMACHGSIRAGRRLSLDEMNALLREMEVTPNAGQCGHGRPTYVALGLKDIERLFGRR